MNDIQERFWWSIIKVSRLFKGIDMFTMIEKSSKKTKRSLKTPIHVNNIGDAIKMANEQKNRVSLAVLKNNNGYAVAYAFPNKKFIVMNPVEEQRFYE